MIHSVDVQLKEWACSFGKIVKTPGKEEKVPPDYTIVAGINSPPERYTPGHNKYGLSATSTPVGTIQPNRQCMEARCQALQVGDSASRFISFYLSLPPAILYVKIYMYLTCLAVILCGTAAAVTATTSACTLCASINHTPSSARGPQALHRPWSHPTPTQLLYPINPSKRSIRQHQHGFSPHSRQL